MKTSAEVSNFIPAVNFASNLIDILFMSVQYQTNRINAIGLMDLLKFIITHNILFYAAYVFLIRF